MYITRRLLLLLLILCICIVQTVVNARPQHSQKQKQQHKQGSERGHYPTISLPLSSLDFHNEYSRHQHHTIHQLGVSLSDNPTKKSKLSQQLFQPHTKSVHHRESATNVHNQLIIKLHETAQQLNRQKNIYPSSLLRRLINTKKQSTTNSKQPPFPPPVITISTTTSYHQHQTKHPQIDDITYESISSNKMTKINNPVLALKTKTTLELMNSKEMETISNESQSIKLKNHSEVFSTTTESPPEETNKTTENNPENYFFQTTTEISNNTNNKNESLQSQGNNNIYNLYPRSNYSLSMENTTLGPIENTTSSKLSIFEVNQNNSLKTNTTFQMNPSTTASIQFLNKSYSKDTSMIFPNVTFTLHDHSSIQTPSTNIINLNISDSNFSTILHSNLYEQMNRNIKENISKTLENNNNSPFIKISNAPIIKKCNVSLDSLITSKNISSDLNQIPINFMQRIGMTNISINSKIKNETNINFGKTTFNITSNSNLNKYLIKNRNITTVTTNSKVDVNIPDQILNNYENMSSKENETFLDTNFYESEIEKELLKAIPTSPSTIYGNNNNNMTKIYISDSTTSGEDVEYSTRASKLIEKENYIDSTIHSTILEEKVNEIKKIIKEEMKDYDEGVHEDKHYLEESFVIHPTDFSLKLSFKVNKEEDAKQHRGDIPMTDEYYHQIHLPNQQVKNNQDNKDYLFFDFTIDRLDPLDDTYDDMIVLDSYDYSYENYITTTKKPKNKKKKKKKKKQKKKTTECFMEISTLPYEDTTRSSILKSNENENNINTKKHQSIISNDMLTTKASSVTESILLNNMDSIGSKNSKISDLESQTSSIVSDTTEKKILYETLSTSFIENTLISTNSSQTTIHTTPIIETSSAFNDFTENTKSIDISSIISDPIVTISSSTDLIENTINKTTRNYFSKTTSSFDSSSITTDLNSLSTISYSKENRVIYETITYLSESNISDSTESTISYETSPSDIYSSVNTTKKASSSIISDSTENTISYETSPNDNYSSESTTIIASTSIISDSAESSISYETTPSDNYSSESTTIIATSSNISDSTENTISYETSPNDNYSSESTTIIASTSIISDSTESTNSHETTPSDNYSSESTTIIATSSIISDSTESTISYDTTTSNNYSSLSTTIIATSSIISDFTESTNSHETPPSDIYSSESTTVIATSSIINDSIESTISYDTTPGDIYSSESTTIIATSSIISDSTESTISYDTTPSDIYSSESTTIIATSSNISDSTESTISYDTTPSDIFSIESTTVIATSSIINDSIESTISYDTTLSDIYSSESTTIIATSSIISDSTESTISYETSPSDIYSSESTTVIATSLNSINIKNRFTIINNDERSADYSSTVSSVKTNVYDNSQMNFSINTDLEHTLFSSISDEIQNLQFYDLKNNGLETKDTSEELFTTFSTINEFDKTLYDPTQSSYINYEKTTISSLFSDNIPIIATTSISEDLLNISSYLTNNNNDTFSNSMDEFINKSNGIGEYDDFHFTTPLFEPSEESSIYENYFEEFLVTYFTENPITEESNNIYTSTQNEGIHMESGTRINYSTTNTNLPLTAENSDSASHLLNISLNTEIVTSPRTSLTSNNDPSSITAFATYDTKTTFSSPTFVSKELLNSSYLDDNNKITILNFEEPLSVTLDYTTSEITSELIISSSSYVSEEINTSNLENENHPFTIILDLNYNLNNSELDKITDNINESKEDITTATTITTTTKTSVTKPPITSSFRTKQSSYLDLFGKFANEAEFEEAYSDFYDLSNINFPSVPDHFYEDYGDFDDGTQGNESVIDIDSSESEEVIHSSPKEQFNQLTGMDLMRTSIASLKQDGYNIGDNLHDDEEDDEDEDDDSSHVWDGNTLIEIIPVVIDELRQGTVTEDERKVLEEVFGELWEYILTVAQSPASKSTATSVMNELIIRKQNEKLNEVKVKFQKRHLNNILKRFIRRRRLKREEPVTTVENLQNDDTGVDEYPNEYYDEAEVERVFEEYVNIAKDEETNKSTHE